MVMITRMFLLRWPLQLGHGAFFLLDIVWVLGDNSGFNTYVADYRQSELRHVRLFLSLRILIKIVEKQYHGLNELLWTLNETGWKNT